MLILHQKRIAPTIVKDSIDDLRDIKIKRK